MPQCGVLHILRYNRRRHRGRTRTERTEAMELAKPRVDVGLNTNNLEPMLAFWQEQVGAKFDHVLPISKGLRQHRHDINGSVLKINYYSDALPQRPPSGYAEVLIAREGLSAPKSLTDPDGNAVSLVPP